MDVTTDNQAALGRDCKGYTCPGEAVISRLGGEVGLDPLQGGSQYVLGRDVHIEQNTSTVRRLHEYIHAKVAKGRMLGNSPPECGSRMSPAVKVGYNADACAE